MRRADLEDLGSAIGADMIPGAFDWIFRDAPLPDGIYVAEVAAFLRTLADAGVELEPRAPGSSEEGPAVFGNLPVVGSRYIPADRLVVIHNGEVVQSWKLVEGWNA